MNEECFLLDTVFIQALLNRHDQYHKQAIQLLPKLKTATEIWITEAILVEVGNAFSAFNRLGASRFINQCYQTPNMHVVSIDTDLLKQALHLYQNRLDKQWGLTDCISFIVMQKQQLTIAITADKHFIQAGFRALLLE